MFDYHPKRLVPYSLTGEAVEQTSVEVDGTQIQLRDPNSHRKTLLKIKEDFPDTICVDYTHPSAANPNADLYASVGLSCVMGTTGGDILAMKKAVAAANGVYAVIAPNMAKQIVAFQAAIDFLAREFPGAFSGYTLTVTESHQSTKADTSGTAKAIVSSFRNLGLDFSVYRITKIRDPPLQMSRMGVPKEHIKGHAFHTYHLTSVDGSVNFEFQHNVCGRRVYAEGTVDAVLYLARKRTSRSSEQVFTMIDFLREGAMS